MKDIKKYRSRSLDSATSNSKASGFFVQLQIECTNLETDNRQILNENLRLSNKILTLEKELAAIKFHQQQIKDIVNREF